MARRALCFGLVLFALGAFVARAGAFGESTNFRIARVQLGGERADVRGNEEAARRITWEVRQRTNIETSAPPAPVRLDDPALFESPFLYWRGETSFEPLSEAEIIGLRRFLEFGGFLLVDELTNAFGESVRRALARALPRAQPRALGADHVLYRSFYLIDRPVGRVLGDETMDHIALDDRVAVVLSTQDLGGAWARDNLGNWLYATSPGGTRQREMAIRLGVNIVMYALCLDYKDDQVHAPYIMRRRAGAGNP